MERIVEEFVQRATEILQDNLTGIYLHGSAVMGCFNPKKSDLDFLIVVNEPMQDEVKLRFMDMVTVLNENGPQKGIEMSIVTKDVCNPFVYPTPFELHFSAMHLKAYRDDPENYISYMKGTDRDLAAHFTIIRERGKCLCGLPIVEVFAEIPKADFLDSVREDIDGAQEEIVENTMYLTLNLARVLAYQKEGLVLSKKEGGEWGLKNVSMKYHSLIRAALKEYTESAEVSYDAELARKYAKYMLLEIGQIRPELQEKLELLEENRGIIIDGFPFEKPLILSAAALLYTLADRKADAERLKECKKILEKNTGLFSDYRKTVEMILLCKMAMSEDAENYLFRVKEIYEKLRGKKFQDHSQSILASVLIYEYEAQNRVDEVLARFEEIMDRMNKDHPLLTCSEDIPYVMLLALSGRDVEAVLADVTECYEYLTKNSKHSLGKDTSQWISEEFAALEGEKIPWCDKVVEIAETFASKKAEYSDGYEFAAVGSLADLEVPADTLVGEILEAERFLKRRRGFSDDKMEKKQRLMYAVILVAESYGKESPAVSNTVLSNTLSILRAKQIGTMISIATSLLSSAASAIPASGEKKSDTSEEAAEE